MDGPTHSRPESGPDDPAGRAAGPRRRRLAFSLRFTLAMVAVLAVAGARVVNNARSQQRAVAAVREAGGRVWYDDEYRYHWRTGDSVAVVPAAGPAWWHAGLKWVRDRLGPDYVHNVVCVMTVGPQLADAGLNPLEEFAHLRMLQIQSRCTDAGLARLRGLTRLQHLEIHGQPVTDAGLSHLKDLSSLRSLTLFACQVRGPGLAALAGLPRLDFVEMEGNPVTDTGLNRVERLPPRLRFLNLNHCPVSEAGVERLRRLRPGLTVEYLGL